MSHGIVPGSTESQQRIDWWSRLFGNRGLLQLIIGDDVEGVLVLLALGILGYLILFRGNYDVLGSFVNILIFVVVFYFFVRLIRLLLRIIEEMKSEQGRGGQH